jgi:hypothetical protein
MQLGQPGAALGSALFAKRFRTPQKLRTAELQILFLWLLGIVKSH